MTKEFGQEFIIEESLGSVSAGNRAGMRRSDLIRNEFGSLRLLELHRAGLISASQVPIFSDIIEHDQRVWATVHRLIRSDRPCIAVAHRSAITAALRRVAVDHLDYPRGYRGHVNIALGSVSIISLTGEQAEVSWANLDLSETALVQRLSQVLQ